jgi:prepilin-type N-terminal cleavage/methylation domain-containing protein
MVAHGQNTQERVMSRRNPAHPRLRPSSGFTLIELLVVIVIIGILAAIALPNYIKVKEKAKEAEVKANLHNVQLSVERFAVDSEGTYPNYLIGGEPKWAEVVNTSSSANAFSNIIPCDPLDKVSDPLLRKGYVDAYPRNPFTSNGLAVHQVQSSIDGNYDDPLRNGAGNSTGNSGQDSGTRFGPYCTSMGSVLGDPRFPQWTYVDVNNGNYAPLNTDANIEYPFWDLWQGNKPLPYLPGQFFYKANGPIIATGTNTAEDAPILPTQIDSYMLGGYGGIRTKGKDVLGQEGQIVYNVRQAGAGGLGSGGVGSPSGPEGFLPMLDPPPPPPPPGDGSGSGTAEHKVWPWTRSVCRETDTDPAHLMGSPYSPANAGDTIEQLEYGNPNGIRDALVLVLTAGEDHRSGGM